MRNLIYITIALLMLLVACETIEDRQELGPVVTADQINLEVYGSTPGGNQIILVNHTPEYGGVWRFGTTRSPKETDTLQVSYLGVDSIKFDAITDGGIVTVIKPYEVTNINLPPFPEWILLAGSTKAGKTWVWDFNSSKLKGFGPWGPGSYLSTDIVPTSGTQSADGSDYEGTQDDEMTFDLNNNAANFTLVTHNTGKKGLAAGTYKGIFKFEVKAANQKARTDGSLWSVGIIKLSSGDKPSISRGYSLSENNKKITDFYVCSITEDELILGYMPKASTGLGDAAQYWVFKAKK